MRKEGEEAKQTAKGGKLFAISKFLWARHSSVQRLIAFLLEGVEKSIFLQWNKKKRTNAQSVMCVFCALNISWQGIVTVTDKNVINILLS